MLNATDTFFMVSRLGRSKSGSERVILRVRGHFDRKGVGSRAKKNGSQIFHSRLSMVHILGKLCTTLRPYAFLGTSSALHRVPIPWFFPYRPPQKPTMATQMSMTPTPYYAES